MNRCEPLPEWEASLEKMFRRELSVLPAFSRSEIKQVRGEFGLLWPLSVPVLSPADFVSTQLSGEALVANAWIRHVFRGVARGVVSEIIQFNLQRSLGRYSRLKCVGVWSRTMEQLGYTVDL